MARHVLFDKRELICTLWKHLRESSREELFFDVVSDLAEAEVDINYGLKIKSLDIDYDAIWDHWVQFGDDDEMRNGR